MSLPERLRDACGGAAAHVVVLDTVPSTQSAAIGVVETAQETEVELGPVLVIARSQSKGRGRGCRPWVSPEGGLYFTWLKSGPTESSLTKLPMLAAAAAASAVERAAGLAPDLKWPNDLLLDGRKLGGVLINSGRRARLWIAVGLGINLDTAPELPDDAIQPAAALTERVEPRPWDVWAEAITPPFVTTLDGWLDNPAEGTALWKKRLIHREGDTLTVRHENGDTLTGTLLGFTDDGHLRLDTDGTETTLTGGDILPARK